MKKIRITIIFASMIEKNKDRKADTVHTCGVILSGGKSSRMGTNKSLLPINNKPSISHIADTLKTCTNGVIVIANESQDYTFLNLPIYPDRYKEKGPLAGFESALYNVNASVYVMAACDMPFVHAGVYRYLLEQLEEFEAVVPIFEDRMHPLSGIYRRSILPKIQSQIENDKLKLKKLFDLINTKYVDTFPNISENIIHKHFFNMNNPTQYEEALRL